MTTEASTDKAQALRVAAELVTEHGVPKDYVDAVDLAALAYLRGDQDARLEINDELRAALTDWASARILRDMEGTPL